ncbi:hypothetical protein JEZ13_12335 [bacterium]|nr:hypothetical protein [bacterium]
MNHYISEIFSFSYILSTRLELEPYFLVLLDGFDQIFEIVRYDAILNSTFDQF